MAPVWRANFEPCGFFTSSQRQPCGFLHRNMIGSCSCQAKNISNSGLQHGLHTLVISCSMGRKLGASKSMPINVTRSRCQKSRYFKGKCWQTCGWIQVSMHADASGMITEVLGTSQWSKQSSYIQILSCVASYWILLHPATMSCVLTGVRTDQVRLLTSRRFPTVERKLQRLQGQGQSLSLFHSLRVHCTSLDLCLLWLVAKFELLVCFKFSCAITSGLVLARWQPCRTSMRWRH